MKTEKQLTAVEMLADNLKKNHGIDLRLYAEFEQAKEMEKNQIMEANEEGFHSGQSMAHNGTCFFESPKDYYNKTFKSE